MEQKVHGQEEAIAQLYRFTGDHERKFHVVEKELNTTYKVVLEAQAEMAVLHDSHCHCGVPGGKHNLLKPAEGRVRQNVTCPIRDGIIYALIWVERSHVTRVSPLWQNRDVILL